MMLESGGDSGEKKISAKPVSPYLCCHAALFLVTH